MPLSTPFSLNGTRLRGVALGCLVFLGANASAARRPDRKEPALPSVKSPATVSGARQTAQMPSLAAGFLNAYSVERISLLDAINMALRNNLEVKVDKLGIAQQQTQVRFQQGVFDPVLSLNTSKESLRRPENSNDFTASDQVRQLNQFTAIRENSAALNANTQAVIANIRATNELRRQLGLQPLPEPDNGVGSGIGGSTSDISSIATINGSNAQGNTSTSDFSVNVPSYSFLPVGGRGINKIYFDQQIDRFGGSLTERTPWGMRLGLFVEANRFRNTFSGDTRDIIPQYQTTVQFQVVQPLLKDFGPGANLANIRVAQIQKKLALLTWKQRLMTSVQGVLSNYYDMIFGLSEIGVRQEAIAADQRLVAQNQRRVEVGFMQLFDVQQAMAQVSLDQEQLIGAKNLLLERQFALKRLITPSLKVNDGRVFLPAEEPTLHIPAVDRSKLLQMAFAHRPDFQQALAEADAQDVRLRFAKNQLLPQLDLVGTYGVNGLTDSYSNSFDETFQGRGAGWTVGVNLRIPLGNIQARAQLDSAKVLKEQAILKIKQTELTIGVDIDTVMSRIESFKQRLETAQKTRELNDQAMRIANRRIQEGQISSFDLIEQQRRLFEARSREVAARAELNKAITQLWLVTGTVLDKLGIQIAEPQR
jgi:outer membrane protein